jgi:hypothetical protein
VGAMDFSSEGGNSSSSSSSGSNSNDAHTQSKLVSLVSIIFCRSICREFRRPVEVMHPTLWSEYKGKVKHPMDLGTLLLTCFRGKATPATVRDSIRLICSNAVEYGKDILDFVGTARHLEFFAAMLFEELLNVPFKPIYSTQLEFTIARSAHRLNRYQLVAKETLLITELNDLYDVLQKWPQSRAPPELTAAVTTSLGIASEILSKKAKNSPRRQDTGDVKITLNDILKPVLQCAQGHSMSQSALYEAILGGKLPSLCYLYTEFEVESIGGTKSVAGPTSESVAWLRAIDEALGGLLTLIVERCLRGCPFSCTWARPMSCVWVQSSRFPRYQYNFPLLLANCYSRCCVAKCLL